MDGSTTGEVKATELGGPTADVPGPVSDRIVDNCGPDEDEEDHGHDAATLGGGADGESGSDGSEHALVDSEDDVGDLGVAHGGIHVDTTEEGVGEVADIRVGRRLGECQTKSPHKPLEGNNGDGEDTEHDQ